MRPAFWAHCPVAATWRRFEPVQLGCGTKGGCEAAVHALRTFLKNSQCQVLLKIDIKNAFNSEGAELSARSHFGSRGQANKVVGWNYHVQESHQLARVSFQCWAASGRFKVSPLTVENVPNLSKDTAWKGTDVIQFKTNDIVSVLKAMSKGKSPGYDGLSVEHIIHAGSSIATRLCSLFNMCIRYSYIPDALMKTVVVPITKNKTGDLGSASNYRPISLGTVVGKVFERLLQPWIQEGCVIDDAQFGFRPGLSTDSAIMSLKHTVNYYTSRETTVYACFLDLSKAFDLVNYEVLWNKLRNTTVPMEVTNLLRYWYENQTNYVKWGDVTSSEYRLECGVRQGGITSPDLFNLYVNDLIAGLRSTRVGCHIGGVCVNSLSYADDMVLLSSSAEGLRRLLHFCEKYAISHGMKYNSSKTEYLIFKAGKGPDRILDVFLNGLPVRRVQQFKYLGHILTDDLKDDKDIERERRALSVRCNMLARKFGRCSDEVKVTLFRAYCQSFYTGQLWTNFTRRAINTLRVQYNDAFRILMKLPRFCSASNNSERAERARLLAAGCREAGHWLNAYPSPNSGTHLDGNTLRVAVGLRVGAVICASHKCHCGSEVDQLGRHGLSCQRSAGRMSRHAALNDIIRRSLTSVNVPAILEPTGIARDDGKRPDGMSLIPWRMGRVLVWDATCVDTLAPSHLHGTTKKAGAAAEAAETNKRRKYGGLDANYNFVAFGVETLEIVNAHFGIILHTTPYIPLSLSLQLPLTQKPHPFVTNITSALIIC
ncbi:uncharacterized protein LOC125234903 [Leguminivora glycinivorella]|uniref:uncharacterized protein LOC125234903 n=1 Tax=Leguminivora glycinivorella TaxID=1035111 RepID=UPI00200FC5FB|nr:uncharacterized protein LOC125234903 [Leguminivora glycinivorella]